MCMNVSEGKDVKRYKFINIYLQSLLVAVV